MPHIKIVNRWNGSILVEGEYNDIKSLISKNSGANLYGADLFEADLSGADLSRADLRNADLYGANLSGANLRNANLSRANLSGADLFGADLFGADLSGADLSRADLRNADLSGANLDFSCWPLWCGSLNVKVDERIKAQLLYHVVSVIGVDKFTDEQLEFANTFHRVGEVPKLQK